jgi:hypothetical protein
MGWNRRIGKVEELVERKRVHAGRMEYVYYWKEQETFK